MRYILVANLWLAKSSSNLQGRLHRAPVGCVGVQRDAPELGLNEKAGLAQEEAVGMVQRQEWDMMGG
jgi:hypothetical protein